MIELSFTMSDADVEYTEAFLQRMNLRKEYATIDLHIPLASVRFFVDGQNLTWCPAARPSEEILLFACGLNVIVHTIQVGQEIEMPRIMDGGTRYFKRIDDSTVRITNDYSEEVTVNCQLSELKASSELFCSQLYEQIMSLFPSYFELMDRLTGHKVFESGETISEITIRQLLLRDSQSLSSAP